MTNSVMTFHESYGTLPTNILRLVKRHNVSPADFDFMLDQFADNDWNLVEAHILDNLTRGMYTPRFF